MRIRSDGRYQKVKKYKGKSYYVYARSPGELEKKYSELIHKLNEGYFEPSKISVYDWSLKWLHLYKSNHEAATYEMYESAVRLYIKSTIGYIRLCDLRQSDIMELMQQMSDKPRQREIVLLTIKQILNSAIDNDLIQKNVARSIKLEKRVKKEKMPVPTDVLTRMSSMLSDPDVFFVYFLAYTGLRKEEVVPLTWNDIDFANRTILVNKAVHFDSNKPVIKSTKNRTSRLVPILDNIYPGLFEISKNFGYVFTSSKGSIMTDQAFRIKIRRATKKLGFSFSAHQLRHTYACILHKAKVPLKEAQYFMRS